MNATTSRLQLALLRQKLAFYLDDTETPAGRAVNWIITGLVLLSSAIFVVQTYTIPASLRLALDAINTGTLIFFAFEYLLRFWCADRKLQYFFSLYALIDLFVILPFFIGAFDVSFLRIIRWFRILRLVRFLGEKPIFGIGTEDRIIIARILFTLFAIIFVYSGLIYQVEHPVNPEAFSTFFDAVYFSVVTMTTVGFGDVIPTSQGGRLMTVLMILTGIALIPWQLGDLIKHLVKTADADEKRKKISCSGCGWLLHDADAHYCKICGTPLQGDKP